MRVGPEPSVTSTSAIGTRAPSRATMPITGAIFAGVSDPFGPPAPCSGSPSARAECSEPPRLWGRGPEGCGSSLTGCGRHAGPRLPCPPHGEHASIGVRQYRPGPSSLSQPDGSGRAAAPPASLPCRDTWPDQPCRAERPRRHPGQGQGFIQHEHAAAITATSSGRPPAEPCTPVSKSCCRRRPITTSTSASASPSRTSTRLYPGGPRRYFWPSGRPPSRKGGRSLLSGAEVAFDTARDDLDVFRDQVVRDGRATGRALAAAGTRGFVGPRQMTFAPMPRPLVPTFTG